MCFALFFIFGAVSKTYAAVLFLEPEKKTVKTGDSFNVQLKIDTGSEQPLAADALILFDSTNLTLVKIDDPPEADKFFPEYYKRINNNKVYIGAAVGPGGTPKAGKGTIATLVFQGAAQSQNVVSFVCDDGKTTDSNITIKSGKTPSDIITCSLLKDGTYDVTGSTNGTPVPTGATGTPHPSVSESPTPSPTRNVTATPSATLSISPSPSLTAALSPTITVTATPTAILSRVPSISPSPSGLPNTGVVENTLLAIGIGVVLTLVSLGIKLAL